MESRARHTLKRDEWSDVWNDLVQAKVSAPTRAGRSLRRSLLKGCVVVIVVAGYSGKRFVYERAHELGIRYSTSTLPVDG